MRQLVIPLKRYASFFFYYVYDITLSTCLHISLFPGCHSSPVVSTALEYFLLTKLPTEKKTI